MCDLNSIYKSKWEGKHVKFLSYYYSNAAMHGTEKSQQETHISFVHVSYEKSLSYRKEKVDLLSNCTLVPSQTFCNFIFKVHVHIDICDFLQ